MDKIDRLLDAIEHPDRYSDQEMEAMLADAEVREVYEMLDKTKASLTPIATPDVDAEWKEFERSHGRRGFRILSLFSRNIAASIAIGLASLAAVAAVVGVSVNYVLDRKEEAPVKETAAVTKEPVITADTLIVSEENPARVPEIIVFENELFETIVDRIAEYYGCKAEFTTDTSKYLRLYFRWNQAMALEDVVESLNNFEQIHLTVKDKTLIID